MPGYKGDIVFMDENTGKKHSIARGPIAIDGSGDKRAYEHHIIGNQHCLVTYSVLTGKVLFIQHDQISCQCCAHLMTKAWIENDWKMVDFSAVDLNHEGECHCNTTNGPAVAEEYACAKAG